MIDAMVTWLRTQLDEDVRVAQAATPGPWTAEDEYRMLPGCRCLSCQENEPYGKAIHEIDAVGEDASPILKAADATFIARHDPAWAQLDIVAKQKILDRYDDCRARRDDPDYPSIAAIEQMREYEDFILPALALSYAGRPGFEEVWAL